MITKVQFAQYRILRNVETTLEPLTILVGPNGAGKSTFMEAIRNITEWFIHHKTVNGFDYLPRHNSERGCIQFDRHCVSWSSFTTTKTDGIISLLQNPHPIPTWVISLRMNPEEIRKATPKAIDISHFAPNGFGLPAYIANLRLTETNERFDFILKAVQAVVPDVAQILIDSTSDPAAYKLEMRTKNGTKIGADHISDGTLCTIGLITALAWARAKGDQGLVLIDDIDSDLHPKAQGELMQQIRALMDHLPGLQIIASTHSPYLLDHVRAQEVRILTASPETGTRIAKLTDHEDYERWKDEMSPGEFWSTVGEDWVGKNKG